MTPLIGVTVSRRTGWRIFPLMAFNLWLAGGRAVKWVTPEDVDLDAVNGVVIGGGDDISPELYGAEVKLEARIDPARDQFEREILEGVFSAQMPVLGICRGAQMLNLALGGTLDRDAYTTFPSRRYRTILPRKRLQIVPGTRLAKLVGTQDMRVNALHTQAVQRLGKDLRISARDDGGMIQAIERTVDPFALGTQWHPEHLFFARRQRRLFQAIVTAARAYSEGRTQTKAVRKNVPDFA